MKRLLILYVLACLLAGCTDEEREDVLSSSVIVLGGQIRSLGRAAQDITRFEEGDRISFFSKGGIEADNILLTYINKEWEHGGDLTFREKRRFLRLTIPVLHWKIGTFMTGTDF